MEQLVDSEISVTNIFKLSSGDHDVLTDNAPLSSERRTPQHRNIPLVTFNAQEKDHEDYNDETDHGATKMKHNVQEKVHNLRITENLIAMIKVRSVLVPIGIILLVVLSFQIPIILYYTDPPAADILDIDVKTCTVSN